jgi:hypothetical protein
MIRFTSPRDDSMAAVSYSGSKLMTVSKPGNISTEKPLGVGGRGKCSVWDRIIADVISKYQMFIGMDSY